MLVTCYGLWAAATTFVAGWSLLAAVVLAGIVIALYASLQHEVIHGHPFANDRLNAALVFPSFTVLIPYLRFRDTHLAHHLDSILTDPYDDPESNYLDPVVWQKLPRAVRAVLAANNTLAGRLLIGTLVSQVAFMLSDLRQARTGDRSVLRGWLWHIPAVALVVLWLVWVGQMPLWAYLIAAYIGVSLLKIRTFLEHRAEERVSKRTVIIEDRGPLSLLFLNNNFHVVHHMHPRVAWYRIPALYFANKDRYLSRNGGYRYPSYLDIFKRYFLKAKDPVPHPLWPRG